MTTTNRENHEAYASISAHVNLSAQYAANIDTIVLRGYHQLYPALSIQMSAGQARTLARDLWAAADAAKPNTLCDEPFEPDENA